MTDLKPPSIAVKLRRTNPWIIGLVWLLLIGQGSLCLTYLLTPEIFTSTPKPSLVKPPSKPKSNFTQPPHQPKLQSPSKPKPPVAAKSASVPKPQPTQATDLAEQVEQGNLTLAEAQLLQEGRQSQLKRPSQAVVPTTQPLPPRTPTTLFPDRMPPRADWLIGTDCRGTRLLGTIRNAGNRTVTNISVTAYYLGNGAEYVRLGSSSPQPSTLAPNEEGTVGFTTPGPCTAGTKLEVSDFRFVE